MPDELPIEAIAALRDGNKIEAIKIVRERGGLGLKESKDIVDEYVRTHPALQAPLDAARMTSNRGCLLAAAVVGGLTLAAYWLLRSP